MFVFIDKDMNFNLTMVKFHIPSSARTLRRINFRMYELNNLLPRIFIKLYKLIY